MDNQDNQKKKRRGQTQITDDTDGFYDPSRTARAYAVRVDSIQSSVTSVYLCRTQRETSHLSAGKVLPFSEKPATFLRQHHPSDTSVH